MHQEACGRSLVRFPSGLRRKRFNGKSSPKNSGLIRQSSCSRSIIRAYAASAFFPSPFDEAVVLTMDGVGEWATTSVAIGRGNELKMIKEIHFPHSLGLLYSAFTYFALDSKSTPGNTS